MSDLNKQNFAISYGQELKQKFPSIEIVKSVANTADESEWLLEMKFPAEESEEMNVRWEAAKLSESYYKKHGVHIIPLSGSVFLGGSS